MSTQPSSQNVILLPLYCIRSSSEAAALIKGGDASSLTLAIANTLMDQAPDEKDVCGKIVFVVIMVICNVMVISFLYSDCIFDAVC